MRQPSGWRAVLICALAVGVGACSRSGEDTGKPEAVGSFRVFGSMGGDGSATWMMEAVPWDHWSGEVDDDSGYQSLETNGAWEFTLAPGVWALAAAQGTCFGVEQVTGEDGDEIEMSIDIDCAG